MRDFHRSLSNAFFGLGFPAYWIIDPKREIRAYESGFTQGRGAPFDPTEITALHEEYVEENPESVQISEFVSAVRASVAAAEHHRIQA